MKKGDSAVVPTFSCGRSRAAPVRRVFNENHPAKKKFAKKALIPLPPTGFTSFFCANRDVVQMILQPRRAVGLRSKAGVSQCAKF
jgi:hypothetical protein